MKIYVGQWKMLMFMHFRWCSWMRLRPRQRTQRKPEYVYRALVALAGLGANTVEVALYPKIEQDADGNTLTGEKSYLLHFESYPQVLEGGFWSVTAPENTTNWLPVGDGGFHLYMRIYTPDMDALDTWTAPAITEIAPSNVN